MKPNQSDYIEEATAHVTEHARYISAVVPQPKPYIVRYPLSSGFLIRSNDTHDLVRKVARAMKARNG